MKFEKLLKFSIALNVDNTIFVADFIKDKLAEIKENFLKIKMYYKTFCIEKIYNNEVDIFYILESEANALFNYIQNDLPVVVHVEIYKIIEEKKYNIFNFKKEEREND